MLLDTSITELHTLTLCLVNRKIPEVVSVRVPSFDLDGGAYIPEEGS